MILGGKEITDILSIKDFKQFGGYDALVQTVYDGDTIHAIYFNNKINRFVTDKFRLARINAAELKKPRGISETEQQKYDRLNLAISARDTLIKLIAGKEVYVEGSSLCPYQRIIAEIMIRVDLLPKDFTYDPECVVIKNDRKYLNISTYLLKNGIVLPWP
jgi:endonuclease YncB( thermonuclease family)